MCFPVLHAYLSSALRFCGTSSIVPAAARCKARTYATTAQRSFSDCTWYLYAGIDRRPFAAFAPGVRHDDRGVAGAFADRLHEPPELVPIFKGHADGEHIGYFYDDPSRPPCGLASNYAWDSAETWWSTRTPLAEIGRFLHGLCAPVPAERAR